MRAWYRWVAVHLVGKTIVLALALTLLVGAFLYTVPGRVDTTLPVRSETADADTVERRPFFEFYASWVGHVVQGDLGRNTRGYPVSRELSSRLTTTALLVGGGALVVTVLSFLGALLVVRRDRHGATVPLAAMYALTALPTFLIAYLAISFFPSTSSGVRYFLPILVLSAGDGLVVELVRALGGGIATELTRPYVDMAVVKGLRRNAFLPLPNTVLHHAFRQAIIHTLPRTALQLQVLVGLSLLVEKIFSLDGLGDMFLDGLGERDVNRVLVVVLATALLVRVMSLANDALILALNPRARAA